MSSVLFFSLFAFFICFFKGGFEYSRHLKQAQVKLISQNDCQKYYSKEEVNGNMLCATGRNWEEDACQVNNPNPNQ